MTDEITPSTEQSLPVYLAGDFVAVDGVAEGDAISFADDLVMDDIYALVPRAERRRLALAADAAARHFTVAAGSTLGAPGNTVHLDCCLTLMAPDGSTQEALILVEVEAGTAAAVYLLPLSALQSGAIYRLVGCDRDTALSRLAEVSCVSFTRGTHITMAGGEQRRIEALAVGDRVLTRDDGAQAIRWIGQTTLRAVGAFAPVTIRKGALHNENDLIVSPEHRLFVYQRHDSLGLGRAEVLVKVRHLVNGSSVVQKDGGFVDYFQILFDEHQIIYAEGIAAESLLIDPRTRPAVPTDVVIKGHAPRAHQGFEIKEALVTGPDAIERCAAPRPPRTEGSRQRLRPWTVSLPPPAKEPLIRSDIARALRVGPCRSCHPRRRTLPCPRAIAVIAVA